MNGNSVVQWAASKLGLSYVWGGTSDSGYDCSGLTQAAYASAGVGLPRTAQEQYNYLNKVSTRDLRLGDLVFFSDTNSASNVTHVGIYSGGSSFIHAANSKDGIITSSLNDSWYSSHFVGAGTTGVNTGAKTNVDIVSDVQTVTTAATDYVKNKAMGVVGNIITVVAVVLVIVLAIVLFMTAFDIKII